MGYLTAGLAVAAVAGLVTWSAFASGVGGVSNGSLVLFLIVAAVAVAELAARVVARLRARSAPLGPPAPAGPGTEGITQAARTGSVLGIVGVGAVVGFLSFLGGMATGGCSTDRCSTAVGVTWGVLMLTQILIFLTALIGAARARYPGQLARAAALGIIGPVLALLIFASAPDPAQYGATAHYRTAGPGHTVLKATSRLRLQATLRDRAGWGCPQAAACDKSASASGTTIVRPRISDPIASKSQAASRTVRVFQPHDQPAATTTAKRAARFSGLLR